MDENNNIIYDAPPIIGGCIAIALSAGKVDIAKSLLNQLYEDRNLYHVCGIDTGNGPDFTAGYPCDQNGA